MKMKKLLDPRNTKSLNQNFRRKRFENFIEFMNSLNFNGNIKILDIGGTQSYWENMIVPENLDVHITLLNLHDEKVSSEKFSSLVGNATDLKEHNNNAFDIVFSNSCIEHLFSWENQKKMADEITRVGKFYYVQTPNLYFPLEPHWLFPFFQFLPKGIKIILTNYLTLGHYTKCNDFEKAKKRVNEVQLLSENDMKKLFPNGKIYREYFFGLVKSITSYS
jgi:hypothetical protein